MRKIIAFMGISLDGFIAGPNGELDWHRVDAELLGDHNRVLGQMSAFIDGRVVHELMASYWPTAEQEPNITAEEKAFAQIWLKMPKIVYSRSQLSTDWNTTVLHEVVPEEVARLKDQPGGDMCLGGAGLIDSFRRLGLIDEYRIYVHPVLAGRGKPLFSDADVIESLTLIDTHVYGNGVVLLHYQAG
jgi:dihydrofolate reductase